VTRARPARNLASQLHPAWCPVRLTCCE
jgi:hypothetical protein